MISSQEIIERSVYSALLETLISTGYSLRPDDYFPVNKTNSIKFQSDKKSIEANKGFFIPLFGISNNQSRGMKECPSITIESKGFMPGDIGLPKAIMEKVDDSYFVSESPYEAIDQYIDIHLIANDQLQMRLLHTLLFASIPQRGYIKPYTFDKAPFYGNIFIEIANFYDMPNTDKGIMEKVYQFTIKDSLVDIYDILPQETDKISPIYSMDILLGYIDDKIMSGNKDDYIKGKDGLYLKSIANQKEYQSFKIEK